MRISILDVLIDDISKEDLLNKIEDFLKRKEKCLIYTINNEFVVEATQNPEFLKILNESTFSIADSAGIVWAAKELHNKKIERIPGANFFLDLSELSQNKKYGIYLLGGEQGVGKKAKLELEKKYPGIVIVGYKDGINIDANVTDNNLINEINLSKPDILCVALGAPKQEMWISNNYKKLNATIFIGIGGTLDFVSGRLKRAPKSFQKMGLEWLYRLTIQPSRYPRIKKALLTFPRLVKRVKTLD